MLEKLKSLLEDDTIYIALLLILVGVGAYGLGRHSMIETSTQPAGVVFIDAPTATEAIGSAEPSIVASVNGTKYHLLSCPGAQQISETNKIFFTSTAEAESAGYEPAANCPGL